MKREKGGRKLMICMHVVDCNSAPVFYIHACSVVAETGAVATDTGPYLLTAVITQEYVLYSSRPVKLWEVLSLDTEMVIGAPPLPVRTRLYVDMLFDIGGATHVMVMVVVPINTILTEVGGSGLGGAVGYCCQA